VSFVSSGVNSASDGFGHGTLVAALAAGSTEGYTRRRAEGEHRLARRSQRPRRRLYERRDRRADWILTNKAQYKIRVANFSVNAGSGASVLSDPLDRAVEKLWLNGVVVVASAGNYAVNGAQRANASWADASWANARLGDIE
jgi:hypothetical protein